MYKIRMKIQFKTRSGEEHALTLQAQVNNDSAFYGQLLQMTKPCFLHAFLLHFLHTMSLCDHFSKGNSGRVLFGYRYL